MRTASFVSRLPKGYSNEVTGVVVITCIELDWRMSKIQTVPVVFITVKQKAKQTAQSRTKNSWLYIYIFYLYA